MEWTEKDDRELAKACASTTIHHLPGQLLMDVFGKFDASNRLRMRRVSRDWNNMLTSHQLMTEGVFVDFDSIFTESDRKDHFLALVGMRRHKWGSKKWTKRLGYELVDMASLMGQHVVKRFAGASTLYVRIGESLRTLEELILERNSKRARAISRLSGKCLASLLRYSYALRIVFCDSVLTETSLIILFSEMSSGFDLHAAKKDGDDRYMDWYRDKIPLVGHGFNRPEWANVFVEELMFQDCQIISELSNYDKPAKSTGIFLATCLENQFTAYDLVCVARDLYSPPSDLRNAYVERIETAYRDKETISGDPVALAKIRDDYLKIFVSGIPDEIGGQSSAGMEFSSLKRSSLFLLDQWLQGLFF